jgi:uncharacterized protein
MIIEIWKVAPAGERFAGAEPAGILELGDAPEVRVVKPVAYDLWVQAVPGELIATGRVATRVRFVCARCAEPFEAEITEPAFTCARTYENKFASVDLTPDMREAILLAFPTHPVCTPSCRGLCARCGTNLNRAFCVCAQPSAGERWGALHNLTLNSGGHHGSTQKKKVEK